MILMNKKFDKDTGFNLVLGFTAIYLIFFTIIAMMRKNYEFLYYGVIVLIIFSLLVIYRKKLYLSLTSLLGLSLAQLIHVLGGNLYIGQVRLYDYWIIENVLRYDNVVHTFTTIILALAVYDILKIYLHEKMHYSKTILILLLVLIVSGIGAFNEIMELGAVIFFHAQDRVGDYMNNAFDLVFNLVGSTIGSIIIISRKEYRENYSKTKKK